MNNPDFELDLLRAAIRALVALTEKCSHIPIAEAYRSTLQMILDGSAWEGMDENDIIEFMEKYA